MVTERRDLDDDVPRSPEAERAVELFARLLESDDDPGHPDRARFDDLVRLHPELRDELLSIWDGMEKFEAISDRLPRMQVVKGGGRWKWVAGWIAAAIVITATVFAINHSQVRKDAPASNAARMPDPSIDEFRRELLGRCEKYLVAAVEPGNAYDKWKQSDSPADTKASGQDGFGPRYVDSVAGLFVSACSIASSSSVIALGIDWPARLSLYRDSLSGKSASDCSRAVRERINSEPKKVQGTGDFLFALAKDEKMISLAKHLRSNTTIPPDIAPFIDDLVLLRPATYTIRAFDADDSFREVTGHIYLQSVDLLTGIPDDVLDAGMTSPQTRALAPGDWRITVVDAGEKEERFSELRVLALPGQDLGSLVTFFRRTDDVRTGMAFRGHCDAIVGTTAAKSGDMDPELPEETVTVGDLYIDPYEVTCREYSDFYQQVSKHPEWFGGTVPVHHPDVLDPDGSCPPELAKMPIVDVTWSEAVLYANWAGKRLPTQREWERVARGSEDKDREFPWDDTDGSDANRVNDVYSQAKAAMDAMARGTRLQSKIPLYRTLKGFATSDRTYDGGATASGDGDRVYRMADNVGEFVEDLFVSGLATDSPRYLMYGVVARVRKGGDWFTGDTANYRTWSRGAVVANVGTKFTGFRCVKSPVPGFATH